MFQEGSGWGEALFEKIFDDKSYRSEIVEGSRKVKNSLSVDVLADGNLYKDGIIIESSRKEEGEEIPYQKNIPLPVVVRLMSKSIPVSDIDKIGETTEILVSEKEEKDVELLVNGEVIGKGIVFKDRGSVKLKITDLFL
ncbi:FliM/FliN family flagellar motor switch protein [Persephonella sp.]